MSLAGHVVNIGRIDRVEVNDLKIKLTADDGSTFELQMSKGGPNDLWQKYVQQAEAIRSAVEERDQ